jgi:hypothetical protein
MAIENAIEKHDRKTRAEARAGHLAGSSTGPSEMRDMLTIKRSKRHHESVKNWGGIEGPGWVGI